MHCHDWPSCLVPIYLKKFKNRSAFNGSKSVLTIHNIGYQGIFSKHDIHYSLLDPEDFTGPETIYPARLNFLEAGVRNADVLTTVSPTYAREIQTEEHGHKLDNLLRERSNSLFGILNGIDYSLWNPETDRHLDYHFSTDNLELKAKLKTQLQKEAGLSIEPGIPLIGMVSRLVEQKGFGELCGPSYGSLYRMCSEMHVQFVILGTGADWCEKELKSIAERLDNLTVYLEFNERRAHLIEAGSDFFLMPSRYEPCGLNQMYSLSYGTLPIVRKTGGLADTVAHHDENTGSGTGFVFESLTPQGIYDAVGEAIQVWTYKPEHIRSMRKQAMKKRFSWESSARKYEQLYIGTLRET
jgi:starch synthase